MATQPKATGKSPAPTNGVKPFPQTIFITEKRGEQPAPPPAATSASES